MKNKKYFLLVILIINIACEKVLDVDPTASIESSKAIRTKQDVENAITGCFDILQSTDYYGRNLIIVPDLIADNLDEAATSQDYAQIYSGAILSDNATIAGIWSTMFNGINRVNIVLKALPNVKDLSATEDSVAKGKLYFLRGLHYFNLVRLYGGIPIKNDPSLDYSKLNQAKNTVSEVYKFIIEDLEKAELCLNSVTKSIPGYPSRYSVSALLAKVYLTCYYLNNDVTYLNNSISKANLVIDGSNSSFSLVNEFGSLFSPGTNSESIFEVAFNSQDGNSLSYYFYSKGLNGRFEIKPSDSIKNNYTIIDTRSKLIAKDKDNVFYVNKYKDITAGSDRVYVIRLADIYLTRAEAMSLLPSPNITQIISDIDKVRFRAGFTNPTNGSIDVLKIIIEKERRLEFAFEGHRWFDLLRTNKALNILPKLNNNINKLLFPIPFDEIQANSAIIQNTGY